MSEETNTNFIVVRPFDSLETPEEFIAFMTSKGFTMPPEGDIKFLNDRLDYPVHLAAITDENKKKNINANLDELAKVSVSNKFDMHSKRSDYSTLSEMFRDVYLASTSGGLEEVMAKLRKDFAGNHIFNWIQTKYNPIVERIKRLKEIDSFVKEVGQYHPDIIVLGNRGENLRRTFSLNGIKLEDYKKINANYLEQLGYRYFVMDANLWEKIQRNYFLCSSETPLPKKFFVSTAATYANYGLRCSPVNVSVVGNEQKNRTRIETAIKDKLDLWKPESIGDDVSSLTRTLTKEYIETRDCFIVDADLDLESQTGIKIVQYIRTHFGYQKPIIMIGHNENAFEKRCASFSLGALDFISKESTNFEGRLVSALEFSQFRSPEKVPNTKDTTLFAIIGPSSVGKSTIAHYYRVNMPEAEIWTPDTTRIQRPINEYGIPDDAVSVSEEEFLKRKYVVIWEGSNGKKYGLTAEQIINGIEHHKSMIFSTASINPITQILDLAKSNEIPGLTPDKIYLQIILPKEQKAETLIARRAKRYRYLAEQLNSVASGAQQQYFAAAEDLERRIMVLPRFYEDVEKIATNNNVSIYRGSAAKNHFRIAKQGLLRNIGQEIYDTSMANARLFGKTLK